MNIRDAILKAADHIERNPKDYSFMEVEFPKGCGTPGCAIGWVGHYAGVTGGFFTRSVHSKCRDVLGVNSDKFYARMNGMGSGWTAESGICAATLRKYADKYHAASPRKERKGIPQEILSIFTERQTNPDRVTA